ncbi:SCO1664 family protein [Mycobacterium sp. MYCO198283]|uniref:SCO1664 family protein n=1 Tax=Mycobacterium sp. MYCO198283 TaxID=2883505 RepID=UPI001E2FEBBC|nr:SCO1664 family protein [Mycobacterium sp. MYCO198283]MCG5432762.1 SCO1664 family protein [Mycobacterium sp. MYCO198283]
MTPSPDDILTLCRGDLTVVGRLRSASNATYLCEAGWQGHVTQCVYKPVAGEQPLWDFPDGTLAGRERASYLVCEALGWNIVPHTIIRDGPAGEGMVQRWIPEPPETSSPDLVDLFPPDKVPPGYLSVLRAYDYAGDEVLLVHADDERLRRMAVFDVVVNNADRKGGHVLTSVDGQVYGVDHGVTLHVQDKLRTVLWGWAGKPVDDDALAAVDGLLSALGGPLADELASLITDYEVDALRARARGLLRNPVMPSPDRRRPIPWPAF